MGAGVLTAESPPFARRGGVLHCGRVTLARRRERYADLIRGETDD